MKEKDVKKKEKNQNNGSNDTKKKKGMKQSNLVNKKKTDTEKRMVKSDKIIKSSKDKIEKESEEIKRNRRKRFFLKFLILIFIFGIGLVKKTLQNDTFYTIKIGELIFSNGII